MPAALSLALEIFGLPALAGLVTSSVFSCFLVLLPQRERFGSIILPWISALSFVAGYAVLPRDFASLAPEAGRPWTWLPCLTLIAALVSSISGMFSNRWTALLAVMIAMLISAITITPTWPVWSLEPPTMRWLILGYLLAVGSCYQCLPRRVPEFVVLLSFAVTAAFLAIATGALVSTRLAQLAAIASGAIGGIAVFRRFAKDRFPSNKASLTVFSVLLAATAAIACIEPDPPQWKVLFIPLLPASLWLVSIVNRTLTQPHTDAAL